MCWPFDPHERTPPPHRAPEAKDYGNPTETHLISALGPGESRLFEGYHFAICRDPDSDVSHVFNDFAYESEVDVCFVAGASECDKTITILAWQAVGITYATLGPEAPHGLATLFIDISHGSSRRIHLCKYVIILFNTP